MPPLLRLDRMLSGQGIGTRREVKKILSDGAVAVNGKRVTCPAMKIDTGEDEVCVHGEPLLYNEHVYIMMNKPSGVISASDDPHAQTVIDLLPEKLRRPGLFPAGRLDRDTEGFLLITDDGTFAHNILSPKKHVKKEYVAIIDSPMTKEQVENFENGLVIDGGFTCLPARVKMLDNVFSCGGVRVAVTIHEGKFHQIKRMFAALGHEVLYLKRTAMGGLQLDAALAPGNARELTSSEVDMIAGSSATHNAVEIKG
jgi:16S rRNA pseudouridine516 synthase